MKSVYEQTVADYAQARQRLADATVAYDKAKHTVRRSLYNAKETGRKLTEEQIRTISMTESFEEEAEYQGALADVAILEQTLAFYNKTI